MPRENDMTSKTVAIGAALALVGVLLGMNLPIAEVQRGGPYALSAGGGSIGGKATYAWRMNLRTGQVSLCGLLLPDAVLSAPEAAAQEGLDTPKCSAWGPAAAR